MLEGLPAEQQAIAQQLLRGGIPAVRTALHFERERAREEGRPEPSTEGVLSLAESLASRVKAAEWRDRAEAALKGADDLAMRDLRSLVSSSDVAREEASRELVVALREMLEQRVEAHRVAWVNEVTKHLDDGHVLRALRLSARPPDPSARFSAELATRLRDSASAALSPSAPSDKWLAVLQAVVDSPVRRTVKPEGLPPNATPELLEAARQQCGRVPALAPLLGLSVPPPPGPARAHSPTRPPAQHAPRRPKPSRPTAPGARAANVASSGGRGAEAAVNEASVSDPVVAETVADVAEPAAVTEAVSAVTEPVVEAVVDVAGPVVAEAEPELAEPVADEAVIDEAGRVAEATEPVAAEIELISEDEPVAAEIEPVAAEIEPVAAEIEPVAAEIEPVAAEIEPVAADIELVDEVEPVVAEIETVALDAPALAIEPVEDADEAPETSVDAAEVAPEPPEEVSAAPAGH
jgi:hypothetical protein